MFNSLGDRFQDIFKKVSGQGRLTESNIKDALREVRLALLEADVNYGVAKNFVAKIRDKAVGEEVIKGVNPYVNTILRFNNKVFGENKVDDTLFARAFVAEKQDEGFIKDFENVVSTDYVDILSKSKYRNFRDTTTEKEVDNTATQILTADNSMNKTDAQPDLFKLTSTDLNIVMITKSGNVMAHIGESEVILVSKTLFNKLCRQPMWCCIDSMMIGDRKVTCLKGLNFNC